MSRNAFLGTLSKIMIADIILIISLIVIMDCVGRYDDTTTSVALAVLMPMLASLALPILHGVHPWRDSHGQGRQLDKNFVFIGFAAAGALGCYLMVILFKQAYKPETISQFLHYLELGDAGLGIYIMLIFNSLAKNDEPREE